MNTTIDSINETRKSITITVPTDIIKEEEAKVLKAAAQQVKIPGFRPGKAPAQMLKTKFGKALDAELRDKVIASAYKHLVDTSGFDLFSVVKVDVKGDKIDQDHDAVLTFLVDVKPVFELPEYKGIEITAPTVEASDAEIQKAIDSILKEHADFQLTDQAAQKGDYVRVSYEGKIGDQAIADLLPRKTIYGTQKSTWEQAGAENVPGVTAVIEGIIEMKAGDHKNVTMHYPADFQIKELAGQVATYEVSVEEVRKLVLPELNSDLFAKLKVESVEQLRDQIRDSIIKHKSNESNNYVKNKIVEHLISASSFAVPESAIKNEEEALLRLYMTRMMHHGLTQEQIEAKQDEMIGIAQKEAASRAKSNMILEAIAKKENIELSNQDLNASVMYEAYKAGMKPQQFVKQLQKDRQLVADIRQNTLFQKVLDFLHKQSKVTFEGAEEKRS